MQLFKRAPRTQPPDQTLRFVDEPFRSRLLSMYRGEPQQGTDGQLHPIDEQTRIWHRQGEVMYKLYVETKPRASLEIGLAFGFSTLYFGAALAKNETGCHIAIDPFQHSHWHDIGLQQMRTTQLPMTFIDATATDALADLQGKTFDYVFIDGNHCFDDVLCDFTNYARLLNINGLILLDDMWMPSVQTAVAFIKTNRLDFVPVSSPEPNLAIFRRTGPDTRDWKHFVSFTAP
jgi:predicted O-methyltransferase YrrM